MDWETALDDFVDANGEKLVQVRRHLHRNPDLSGKEQPTIKYLQEQLTKELGEFDCSLHAEGRGLIVDGGSSEGKRVAFRGDIDALPIQDAKGLDYSSQVPGVMHACGHDAHTTIAFGTVLALKHISQHLSSPISWRGIFQPSEEVGSGAQELVEEGVMEGVSAIYSLHCDPTLAVGMVGYRSGALTACCDELSVYFRGQGGHAARPFITKDPISALVLFINNAYALVPRSVDALSSSVLSFCSIQAGSSGNVIPDEAKLMGTIRSIARPTSRAILGQLEAVAKGVSESTGVEVVVKGGHSLDAVINDEAEVKIAVEAARRVVGDSSLYKIPNPSMGGEDFSGYLQVVPGCMIRLGVAVDPVTHPRLHTACFDIDEKSLLIGVKFLARCVVMRRILGSSS